MPPTIEHIRRLTERLRLATTLIAVYETQPSDVFAPLVELTETTCCFAYYGRWLTGETLVIRKGGMGCRGAQSAFGFERTPRPFMAHFLTDGVGAPKGEGLKATAAVAQAVLDRAKPPDVRSDAVLIGPLRPEQWDKVRSVTFLVDPDRLAGVMTLAGYWSADNVVTAPFGSGCSFLWRALGEARDDRAVIGATDIAMRRHLPPGILMLTVTPARFEQMLSFPDDSFLFRPWWNELMDLRAQQPRPDRI
jgi:hypothetical protein